MRTYKFIDYIKYQIEVQEKGTDGIAGLIADFNSDIERLEVLGTYENIRRHVFSLASDKVKKDFFEFTCKYREYCDQRDYTDENKANITLNLKPAYEALCKMYSENWDVLTGFSGRWNDDFSLLVTDDWGAFSLDEIRYVVDNSSKLSLSYPNLAHVIFEWVDYCMDCYEFNIQYISLESWLKGAPRMSKEQIQHLRDVKKALEDSITKVQEEFGKIATDSIPARRNKREK